MLDNRIRFFNLKLNSGVSNCRNLAISKSKGEYYCFLDSDDIWCNNKLELQLNFMKKNNFLFSFTSYRMINSTNVIIKNKISVPQKITYNGLLKENIIACSTVMINQKLCNKYWLAIVLIFNNLPILSVLIGLINDVSDFLLFFFITWCSLLNVTDFLETLRGFLNTSYERLNEKGI